MSKYLDFNHNGKVYRLEYTRSTVAMMEKRGFVASDIETKPVTILPALFAGAFLAHHRNVSPDVIDAMYDKATNKQDLIGKLAEMYNEPIKALIEEPEESEGNATWTASW